MAAADWARGVPDETPPSASRVAVVVTFPARVDRADITAISDRARSLMEATGATLVIADTASVTQPDLAAVEALVRLKLVASRLGGAVRLRGASAALRDLLAFAGLDDVITW